jgi:hypothetical protein
MLLSVVYSKQILARGYEHMPVKKWFVNHRELYDYISDMVKEGKTAKEAIEEYSELSQLPVHRVRTSYYDIKREELGKQLKTIDVEPIKNDPEDIVQVVGKIVRLGQEAKIDVEAVLRSLVPLFEAAVSKDKDEQIKALEGQLQELKEQYSKVNDRISEFLRLPSLKKFADLEDFTHDIKYMVDNRGMVQRI